MRKWCLALFCVLFLSLCGDAWSLSFKIDRLRIREEVTPGQVVEGVINAINDGDIPLTISGSLSDFLWDEKEGIRLRPRGALKNSCANWIRLIPEKVDVPPHSSRAIRYIITVPQEGLDMAEYFAMVFMESADPSLGVSEGAFLKAKVRLACRARMRVKGKCQPAGKMIKVDVRYNEEEDEFHVGYVFENTGNTRQFVNGYFSIVDKEGNLFGRGALALGVANPGKQCTVWSVWDGELDPGSYDVVAEMRFEPDQVEIVEASFEVKDE